MTRTASIIGLVALIYVTLASGDGSRAATPSGDSTMDGQETPLELRAEDLLKSFPEAKSKKERTVVRRQLLAMADSLEAKSSLVLASQCLERAGMIGYYFGEFDAAVAAWDRGLGVARRSGDPRRIAALLNAKGIGVSATGDNETAIEIQSDLLPVRQELGDKRGEASTWHNLAYSYLALYRFPEAIECLEHAIPLHREVGNVYGLAASTLALSGALFQMGSLGDALVLADSAVVISQRVGQPQLTGLALGGRGLQLQEAGRSEDALADFDRAVDICAASGLARMLAITRVNRAATLTWLGRCDEAVAALVQAKPVLEQTGDEAERNTARGVEATALIDCGSLDEGRRVLVATIESLESLRDSLDADVARAEAVRAGGWAYAELAALDAAEGRQDDAWLSIENGTATLWRSRLGLDAATGDDLVRFERALGEIDAIALQFGYAPYRNVVAVVTPTSVEVSSFRPEAGVAGITSRLLQLMSSGASDADCAPLLEQISNEVLGPIASVLDAGASRLIVIPGAFEGVPFEELPIPGGGTLGDAFPVSYAPSASAFVVLRERSVPSDDVVVFADPAPIDVFAGPEAVAMRSARLDRGPLPEARREAEEVAGAGGRSFVGGEARKTEYLAWAPRAAVIHFATHALIDGGHPDYSLIILAGENEDEAVLTAGEIEASEIASDLVTLSGCSTAGGYTVPGEGALGLASAFHLAGARSVIASRWDVEDGAARRFMELFYGALRSGSDRDVAMQQVRRQMKQEGYPYRDRAAFVLTGVTGEPVAAIAAKGGAGNRGLVLMGLGLVAFLILLTILFSRSRRRA